MNGKRWAHTFGIAAAMLVPAIAVGALTIPYSFSDGNVVSATEMNANFSAIETEVDLIDGRVAVLEATNTYYEVIQPSDFARNQADHDPPELRVVNSLLAVDRSGLALNTNLHQTQATAPIHLPQGAEITEIRCGYLDDDPWYLEVHFTVMDWDAPNVTTPETFSTNGQAGNVSYQQGIITPSSPIAIDNQTYSYRLAVYLHVRDNVGEFSNGTLALAGCRIQYDLAGIPPG